MFIYIVVAQSALELRKGKKKKSKNKAKKTKKDKGKKEKKRATRHQGMLEAFPPPQEKVLAPWPQVLHQDPAHPQRMTRA